MSLGDFDRQHSMTSPLECYVRSAAVNAHTSHKAVQVEEGRRWLRKCDGVDVSSARYVREPLLLGHHMGRIEMAYCHLCFIADVIPEASKSAPGGVSMTFDETSRDRIVPLRFHRDCGPLCPEHGDPRDTSVDLPRLLRAPASNPETVFALGIAVGVIAAFVISGLVVAARALL